MDFLSRLIAGSGSSPTKQKANTPAERLATCKRVCNALQQIWRNGSSLAEDEAAKAHIAACIKRLNAILNDESRKTAPHSCLAYVTATTQLYIIITKLTISTEDADIIAASAHFFHILVNGETDSLLDSKIFARSLVDLVRKSVGVDEQGQAALIELLFEICTKIRIDPDNLPAWFYPERGNSSSRIAGTLPHIQTASPLTARQDQFPLFYLLVDFVHSDGSSGDFARTGLLYLIETASKSPKLEQWMIESDLAPQMASGLGALYSRLSRTPFEASRKNLPPIIEHSDSKMPGNYPEDVPEKQPEEESEDADAETSSSEALHNVDAFLSYLAFWQDTLNHCSSQEVADTLLDHFQVLFVQQLLYPSLLESSDMDGGSTASVIAHLYRILDSLEHRETVQRILSYLLASEEQRAASGQAKRRRPRMSISRRKSMEKLAALAEFQDNPSPDLFNLLDLIILSLRSPRGQTSTAALKLLSVTIRKHHDVVTTGLFKTYAADETARTRDLLNGELSELIHSATSISKTSKIDQAYQTLLSDVQTMLDEHPCSMETREDSFQGTPGTPQSFQIAPDCKLMRALWTLFQSFFWNDTMTNLTLTETVMCLASCRHISLRGWLLAPIEGVPSGSDRLSILDGLNCQIDQVSKWRTEFSSWDVLFAMQQSRLFDEPTAEVHPQSPKRISFERPMSPTGLGISSSPGVKPVVGSSLRHSVKADDTPKPLTPAELDDTLAIQIELPKIAASAQADALNPSITERLIVDQSSMASRSPSEGIGSGAVTPNARGRAERTSVSLGHVLTNAIILQEFLLEIAAVVQIRASLFNEVEVKI